MDNLNNHDESKKLLDLLKEQAENTPLNEDIVPQTTEGANSSDDDIKNMLKQQFGAAKSESTPISEDYSFDTEDFVMTGEIKVETDEEKVEEVFIADETKVEVEEIQEKVEISNIEPEEIEDSQPESEHVDIKEIFEAPAQYTQMSFEEENQLSTIASDEIDNIDYVEEIVQEILDEADEVAKETVEEMGETKGIEQNYEATMPFEPIESVSDATNVFTTADKEITNEETLSQEDNLSNADETPIDENGAEEGPLSEESINYDEILEGQQGTVFNNFVEDFTGDLDDVVFEAEITASQAPEKQYTIFEDWEQLMKDKQYETAEEGIIPPTKEELAYSAEIAARTASGQTDYFTAITPESELDPVDIALMAALGVDSGTDQTVGFDKIHQAVNSEKNDSEISADKSLYGFCGEEYTSILQTGKIKKKYKSDKKKLSIKAIATAIIALLLIGYEMSGWLGFEFLGIQSKQITPVAQIIIGLQFLIIAIAISCSKIKTLFKNVFEFSSISYLGAMILSLFSIIHDFLILTVGIEYAKPTETVHSLAVILLLLSLVYDLFDLHSQSGAFDIVSRTNKKLVLEPYGKIRIGENEDDGDIIDKDSYCISRVSNDKGFFARMARSSKNTTGKLITLVLSLSVSFCVMLGLLLSKEKIGTIVLSLIVTLSFSLIMASVFESEFAYFLSYKVLKKYKTGIIGKTSVEEYGQSNIIYFDDYNVFNKKSVRTKGLKLYDNNEIYRILYHTQAVFSKIGGPLKGVFEFATTEMLHSRNVEIKHISKEGISAMVDNRTPVLIGTGSFMKSRGIHPSYTSADLKLEESGEESIVFIALCGKLGAKLYVTYQFSSEFERLAKKLTSCGIGIGIRSSDPSVNDKWAKSYGAAKKCSISVVRPTLRELKAQDKPLESGIVSAKNVRAISEAIMMCTRLYSFESLISKIRMGAIVLIGVLTFILVRISGINAISMLLLMLACALGASVMMLLSNFYIKR